MKAKASVVAQKLLNLYRQEHVIEGGWAAVNKVLVAEATQDVLSELKDLPTGRMLVRHIANLRDGTTPMDSIARELLPYGGLMAETTNVVLAPDETQEVIDAINSFTPDENGLTRFMQSDIIQQIGADWPNILRTALANNRDASNKLKEIVKIKNAHQMWSKANDIISRPINDRTRAQLQVDIPEYETYLPMYGDRGADLLKQLHTMLSSFPDSEITVSGTPNA